MPGSGLSVNIGRSLRLEGGPSAEAHRHAERLHKARARACASPQPSCLAAKSNDATRRQLVGADDPATDNSKRRLVAAEDTGSDASHDTVQVHARVPSGAGRDRY